MLRPIEVRAKTLSRMAEILGAALHEQNPSITGITQDSQSIMAGDIFLGLPGLRTHGAEYVADAALRGAAAMLTDKEGSKYPSNIPLIIVEDVRKAAGILSAWFYGEPMRDMFSVGITGTNGKTTTTTLLHQIWHSAGRKSGLIGTINTQINDQIFPNKRTTPESSELQAIVALMRESNIKNLAMEVSSHAIALERVRGAHYSLLAFSNLSQDHLDFHHSMEEYFAVKAKIFSFEFAERALINVDDSYGRRLVNQSELPITTISRHEIKADWNFRSITPTSQGFQVSIRGAGGVLIEGVLPLFGEHNLDNALMAIAMAHQSGVDPIEIQQILPQMKGAPGRFEAINLGQNFGAYIDYAHSPDAVSRVLETCRAMGKGRIIALLGCGGDRDSSKRFIMGQALRAGSDIAIFTSDNPRSEDPSAILDEMIGSLPVVKPSAVILNRSEAIRYAVSQAREGDIVILLGKGHEVGQEILGVINPFDDHYELTSAISGS